MKLFKNGYVWHNSEIRKADFTVEDGKFVKIEAEIVPSQLCETIDFSGKYVYPGMVDAHTHVGIFEECTGWTAGDDVNETSSPATPGMRAIDAINPLDPGIESARNSGFTTVCVLPGSANVIGGEGVVIKTAGTVVDKMVVPTEKKIIKLAFGWNPVWFWGSQDKSPKTRLAVSALLREKLTAAKNYMKKEEKEYDYDMENLSALLKKEAIARIHVANLEDIETIGRVAKEFDFDYVLDHATALHTNPEFAKSLEVPVILGPLNVAGKSFQTYDLTFDSVKILHDAGLKLSIMTDAPVIPLNLAKIQMWLIDRLRMDRADIIDMFTINPAAVLGLDKKIGSIEEGKDADFFVSTGDIFDYTTKIEHTYIEGIRVGGEE